MNWFQNPLQREFQFEYERPETKEEEKKREKTYLEKHDERYKRIMKINDLEDKIMGVWSTCEDIDTFLYRYSDSPAREMSEDDIANTLLGIKTLHEQRCQRLWDAFEQVLANNATTKPEGSIVVLDDQQRLDSMGLEGLRSG